MTLEDGKISPTPPRKQRKEQRKEWPIEYHRHNQRVAERDLVVMILPGHIIKAPNAWVHCVFGNA